MNEGNDTFIHGEIRHPLDGTSSLTATGAMASDYLIVALDKSNSQIVFAFLYKNGTIFRKMHINSCSG